MRNGYINLPNVVYDPTNFKTIYAEDINEIVDAITSPTQISSLQTSSEQLFQKSVGVTLTPNQQTLGTLATSRWFGRVSLFVNLLDFVSNGNVVITIKKNTIVVYGPTLVPYVADGAYNFYDLDLNYGDVLEYTVKNSPASPDNITLDTVGIGYTLAQQDVFA